MESKHDPHPYENDLLPFDPIVIVRDVLSHWLLIITMAIIVGIGAFIIKEGTYQPVYRSTATLVVSTRDASRSVYNNIDSAGNLATVFTEIINSSVLENKVLDQLNMVEFDGTIAASRIENTNLLTISVTGSDPRTVFLVIRAIIDNHEVITYDIIGNISVEVLQVPTVPTAPINRSESNGVMKKAMLISAAAACVLFAVMSYYRDSIRSRKEAEKKLNCWCLGEIHHEKKNKTIRDFFARRKRSVLITRPETSFLFVSTMGKLRHRVEQHMHDDKILMITSVMENEGKSTVAVNLALSMAKKHSKVLLIDCDIHKPACHKILGLEQPLFYLNDVLRDGVPMENAIQTDKFYGLHILPSKRLPHAAASDLVNTDTFRELLNQAREEYDYVVIDMPPMSAATDAEFVMELVDATLLVVRQNFAAASSVNRAISVLQSGNSRNLGCVLNNVYTTYISSGEGYAAGYGRYGSYGKYGKYGRYASK